MAVDFRQFQTINLFLLGNGHTVASLKNLRLKVFRFDPCVSIPQGLRSTSLNAAPPLGGQTAALVLVQFAIRYKLYGQRTH